MLAGKTPYSRFAVGVVVGAIVALVLAALTTKAFFVRRAPPNNSPFLTEGFDFGLLRAADNEWRGPNTGETIDLTRLKMNDGKTLASVIGKQPAVLVLVSPTCPMCKTASDEMGYLREKLAGMEINYYLVSFTPPPLNVDFFKYGDSLRVGVPSFLWDTASGAPPSSLLMMTVPSHLLVKSDGTIICVWPGSYNEKGVRDRMAHQILADTLVATNTLNAILPKTDAH